MPGRLRLGISTCLLGEPVRYDGGHKRDRFLTDILGRFVEYVPVCPEVECGLPVPREAMRLVGDPGHPRLVTQRSAIDHTERLREWSEKRVRELEKEELCGFVFKQSSPSSGMERVKVYNDSGVAQKVGVGLFAQAFMNHFPLIPTEEEGRLHDVRLRENFIERLFAFKRWQDSVSAKPNAAALMEFHGRHKLLLMAHDVKSVSQLGRLIAKVDEASCRDVADRYIQQFMGAMKKQATTAKNVNVMMHILGYFKKQLNNDEKQETLELIAQYRQGHLPLIVPLTLFNHYVRKYDQAYLRRQHYLKPGPLELHLRNHA